MKSIYYKSDIEFNLDNIPEDYDYLIFKFYDVENHTIIVGDDPNGHSGETLSDTSKIEISGNSAVVFLNNHNFVPGMLLCQIKVGREVDSEIFDSVTGKIPVCYLYNERKPLPHERPFPVENLDRINYKNFGLNPSTPFRVDDKLLLANILQYGVASNATVAEIRALNTKAVPPYILCTGNSRLYHYDAGSTSTDDGATVLEPASGDGRWLSVMSFSESNITSTQISNWDYAYANYANVIESISVNGTPLTPSEKAVNIVLQENVQANWTQTSTSAPDFIKNKPNNLATTSDLADFVKKIIVGGTEFTPSSGTLTMNLTGFLEGVAVDGTELTPVNNVVNIDLATPLASKLETVKFNGNSATVSGTEASITYIPDVADLTVAGVTVEQNSTYSGTPQEFRLFAYIQGEWKYLDIETLKVILESLT